MNDVKTKYYDQNPDKRWVFCFDALFIQRDHRKILNREPAVIERWPFVFMIIDFKALRN